MATMKSSQVSQREFRKTRKNENRLFDLKFGFHRSLLTDVQLYSAPGDGEETEVDVLTDIESPEKKSVETHSNFNRPWSEISTIPSSNLTRRAQPSQAYRFVQLERALVKAKLLDKKEDRIRFEDDYFESIRRETFDDYLEKYYLKIHEHYQQLKKDEELRKSRTFAFQDLEKNFLALDPCRDVRIIFVDENEHSKLYRSG